MRYRYYRSLKAKPVKYYLYLATMLSLVYSVIPCTKVADITTTDYRL